MTETQTSAVAAFTPADLFVVHDSPEASIPIRLIADTQPLAEHTGLSDADRRWLDAVRFTGAAKRQALIPGADSGPAAAVLGQGNGAAGDPSGPSELLIGQLAATLPPGLYHLGETTTEPHLAAVAWGLGAYRFRRYKTQANGDRPASLKLPQGVNRDAVLNEVEAVWAGRDLINTPASDLGPAELEAAVRELGKLYGATVMSIVGEDLLTQGFRMIHAVGRANPRAPRLIDLRWTKPGGRADAPSITLVGKGITFDTGGLDIKPSSGMLLMKKDMGGAAAAMTLARMIMGAGFDVRLSVAGDAFRPGDVLTSRAGKTVEIGNTDAEGRLVLADALSLADEEAPDTMMVFATLTGAARTALGPDLPAMFTDDEQLAASLFATARSVGDPVWRLPFWAGYERNLDSEIADMNNVSDGPFAGAITAALFLRRFVTRARRFAHFDLYGWRPAPRPLGPKGGEPQTARAVFALLKQELGR
jgi:leucyl aminopeptidase